MTRRGAIIATTLLFTACGSPEKYQKQGAEADSASVEATFGIDVGREHRPWAQRFIETMGQSRLQYDVGDTVRAFAMADSLIRDAETSLDALARDDPRTKFLVVVLTDLHSQVITWAQLSGDTLDVNRRMSRFEALAARARRLRDSLDHLP